MRSTHRLTDTMSRWRSLGIFFCFPVKCWQPIINTDRKMHAENGTSLWDSKVHPMKCKSANVGSNAKRKYEFILIIRSAFKTAPQICLHVNTQSQCRGERGGRLSLIFLGFLNSHTPKHIWHVLHESFDL